MHSLQYHAVHPSRRVLTSWNLFVIWWLESSTTRREATRLVKHQARYHIATRNISQHLATSHRMQYNAIHCNSIFRFQGHDGTTVMVNGCVDLRIARWRLLPLVLFTVHWGLPSNSICLLIDMHEQSLCTLRKYIMHIAEAWLRLDIHNHMKWLWRVSPSLDVLQCMHTAPP